MQDGVWRNVLHEYIVYGLLFKALAFDASILEQTTTKLRYNPILEKLSIMAEREHHRYRRELNKLGCKVVKTEQQAVGYCVTARVRGHVQEAIYSVETLRVECEVRLERLIEQADSAAEKQ
ncbi:hypothetical protein QO009_002060 [Brevibacillus aydinogluensis]|uniref:hypothetical protein n=1 Tax=Brevibacillus aydinogluensis TaxID=927786 RepID=UPI002892DF35|nr:hypothetical protein [Brevibacillus aydinogluensis]MDT3416192.1 hypothetical protein [Brevibacillus aydinogluensis]